MDTFRIGLCNTYSRLEGCTLGKVSSSPNLKQLIEILNLILEGHFCAENYSKNYKAVVLETFSAKKWPSRIGFRH